MEQQQAAFLAVAGIAAAVGLGLFFVGGGPVAPTGSPTATPAGSPTPTSGPAASPTPNTSPTTTLPPSPTPFENRTQRYSFDGPELNRTHFFRLAEVGNYTARSNLTIDGESSTNHVNVSYVMDLQDDREYSVQVFTYRYTNGEDKLFPVVSTYTEGDTTWERRQERTGQENSTVEQYEAPYQGGAEPVSTTLALDIGDIATGVIDRSSWAYTGKSRSDGVTRYRFDANGTHLDAAVRGNVTGGSATFVVRGDGIVRYVAYDFTVVEPDGERVRYVYESFYGRLGETDVPRPSWAD